jgi:glycosyltransferase involved in cell wall biosynthesis
MMSVDLTVAIPTYNGAKRLPEVLDQLQSLHTIPSKSFSWEVIVIDNNSTDDTAQVIQAYQKNWSQQYPLKYYFEPQQGAAFARRRAFTEANATLIGFLDDDNIPAYNWVEAAYKFAQQHPKAGAYGSQIQGVFEVAPPENFQRIAPFLAITQKGLNPLLYEPQKKVLPPSAGLVVRQQAWLESVPDQLILTGRTQTSMVTSEDLEMLAHIQAKGWEIWYNPAMKIDHKIPHWRLNREYLIPFFQGIGLSRHVTRMLSVKPWQRPLATVAYLSNDLRKIAVHLLKYGTNVQSDLIAACEMELFISSLISPFYLWKKGYYKRK